MHYSIRFVTTPGLTILYLAAITRFYAWLNCQQMRGPYISHHIRAECYCYDASHWQCTAVSSYPLVGRIVSRLNIVDYVMLKSETTRSRHVCDVQHRCFLDLQIIAVLQYCWYFHVAGRCLNLHIFLLYAVKKCTHRRRLSGSLSSECSQRKSSVGAALP